VSRGLTVQEAHTLFRDYVDDPDATFISTAQVTRYLGFGLDQWRDIIRITNPQIYGSVVKFNGLTALPSDYQAQPASTKPYRNSLDLGTATVLGVGLASSISAAPNAVMGPEAVTNWFNPAGSTLTQAPIDTIIDVYRYGASENIRGDRYRQLRGAKEQELSALGWTYYLTGNALVFNSLPSSSLIIEYFPIAQQEMDYANTDYIEGNLLPQFHELIVLLAAKRYMIRDQNVNEILLKEMAAQMQGMIDYLTRTQLLGSNDSVSVTTSF
jgi:hypothetical protein